MRKEKSFDVKLETLEPIRIGGKEDPRRKDNLIAVMNGRAIVPGTSLKGALRAQIENALIEKYYDFENNKWNGDRSLMPCIPAPEGALTRDEKKLVAKAMYRDHICSYPNDESLCPVCYILGAASMPGFVTVPFLYSEEKSSGLYGTRVDRAVGGVVQRTNRPFEYVEKDIKFNGELIILLEDKKLGWKFGNPRHLDKMVDKWITKEWDSKKIFEDLVKKPLENITYLGGYKSKGFGKIKITIEPSEL